MCFTQYIERANVPQLLKKKQSAKHKSAKKTAQRTSKYQLKHAEREATRKPSKKPAAPQKNKPKFTVKPQCWQHCRTSTSHFILFLNCICYNHNFFANLSHVIKRHHFFVCVA